MKKPLEMPAPGSDVRLVIRDVGEVFGVIIPAKVRSGRWPFVPWGLSQTACVDPATIEHVERARVRGAEISEIANKQRSRFGDGQLARIFGR